MRRFSPVVISLFAAVVLILPGAALAAGTCSVACAPASGPARAARTASDPDDAACQVRCTPLSPATHPRGCEVGDTCRATFTATPADATPPTSAPASTQTPPSTATPPAAPNRGPVALELSQAINGVTVVSDFGNYIAVLFRYAIGLAGTAAVIMIVYGGFLFLLGSAVDDVGKGKQVIQDALIGLLLVLGSYLILATVNPNTLSLKLPDIRPIEPVPLPTNVYGENGGQQRETPQTVSCARDGDCAAGETCIRYNYKRRNTADDGGIADSIFEFLGAETNRSDWDVEADRTAKLGSCTSGLVGQRCICAGRGCELAVGGSLVVQIGEESRRGFVTNNNVSGIQACQGSLKCIFERPTGGFWGWYCRDVPSRALTPALTQARSALPVSPCSSDAACRTRQPAKRACVAIASTALTSDIQGECSDGGLGERCRCKNVGCRNNYGAQVEVACSAGLECQLFGHGNNGLVADWFCAPPLTPPASTPTPGSAPAPTPTPTPAPTP